MSYGHNGECRSGVANLFVKCEKCIEDVYQVLNKASIECVNEVPKV